MLALPTQPSQPSKNQPTVRHPFFEENAFSLPPTISIEPTYQTLYQDAVIKEYTEDTQPLFQLQFNTLLDKFDVLGQAFEAFEPEEKDTYTNAITTIKNRIFN